MDLYKIDLYASCIRKEHKERFFGRRDLLAQKKPKSSITNRGLGWTMPKRSWRHSSPPKFMPNELEQIKQLVTSGVYLNTSDFVMDAIRDKLVAIKTIKYRNVDYDTAKKEVMGYFQDRGETYPSEIEEDLELDYKLICQIVNELKREGRLEVL
jgi:Arc/MetJ-type ribon-helix-helix transcriptional regulator